MKPEKQKIILCDYTSCGKSETCAFYCPSMDKTKTLHFGADPYPVTKGRCYQKRETDIKWENLVK
jgi:hypothetical protein